MENGLVFNSSSLAGILVGLCVGTPVIGFLMEFTNYGLVGNIGLISSYIFLLSLIHCFHVLVGGLALGLAVNTTSYGLVLLSSGVWMITGLGSGIVIVSKGVAVSGLESNSSYVAMELSGFIVYFPCNKHNMTTRGNIRAGVLATVTLMCATLSVGQWWY